MNLQAPNLKKTQQISVWGKKVTFDRTLEIIRIILKLHSQILKSALDADIMLIIAASKKVWIILLPFVFYDQIMRVISALLNL